MDKKYKVICKNTHTDEVEVEGYYDKKDIAVEVAREKTKAEIEKKSNMKYYAYDFEGNLIGGDDWNEE